MCTRCGKLNVWVFVKDRVFVKRKFNELNRPKQFIFYDKSNVNNYIILDFDYCPFCGENMDNLPIQVSSEIIEDITTDEDRDPMSVDMLNLGVSIIQTLYADGYKTIDSIMKAGASGIRKIKGIGPSAIAKIAKALEDKGYDSKEFMKM